MDALAPFQAVRRALDKIRTLDDAVDVADKAQAAMVYCKRAKLGVDNFNLAAEAKIWAERKAGEFLTKMGKRKNQHAAHNTMLPATLKELGIEPIQSSRWQRIATVPEKSLTSHLELCKSSGKEITTKSVLQLASRKAKPKPDQESPGATDQVDTLADLSGQRFACIYADPPWQYGNQATRAATDNHYDTMTVDAICDMPIESLAADDAHLHIWTTNAFLPQTFRVIEAWGFEYRSCFVWVKPQMGIGNYWRVSHEFLLLGIRGNAKRFNNRSLMSWASIKRNAHSAKPEEIRAMIELASAGPRLELFGRKPVDGWTVFGNQIEQRLFAS